jgi:LacI family transcriptional regulator
VEKLNITEIARRAGVSIATVSRALNGRSRIDPQTRAAILEIVRQTGYIPDAGARRLARGTRQLVGVTPLSVFSLRNPYYAYLLDAVQEGLFNQGFVARVINPDNQSLAETCAGFIVPGIGLDDGQVQSLMSRGFRVAVVGRVDQNVPWVDVDNHQGIGLAVDHLVRLGHTRIAHLTGSPIGLAAQQRLEGYRAALEAHQLPYDPALVYDGGYTEMRSFLTVDAAINKHGGLPFTAIAAFTDEMAMGAIQAIVHNGYQVPRDVSVTGFDDLEYAQFTDPPLTTVRQPIREVGLTIAELFLGTLEGAAATQIVLPTRLVVRASTGPQIGSRS